MAKIMLVEDDNNLREIYEARLAAEGYEIVSAADGEAALSLAIKEKPDLIISDIMMPNVSGFDMLDILRDTAETKHTKVIVMTALNQAEDKVRAEKLGADLYLVKSQVTLEDVVRSAKNLLGEQTPLSVGSIPVESPPTANTAVATSLSSNMAPPPANQSPEPAPVTPATTPVTPAPAQAEPGTTPNEPTAQAQPNQQPAIDPAANLAIANSTSEEEAALQAQIEQFITSGQEQPATPQPDIQTPPPAESVPTTQTSPISTNPPTPTEQLPPMPTTPTPTEAPASTMAQPPTNTQLNPPVDLPKEYRPAAEQVIEKTAPTTNSDEPLVDASISGRKKVIEPISDVLTNGPNIEALLAKENAQTNTTSPTANSIVTPEGVTMPPIPSPPTNGVGNDVIAPQQPTVSAPQVDNLSTPPGPPIA